MLLGPGAGRVEGVCSKYMQPGLPMTCVLDLLQPDIFKPSLALVARSTLLHKISLQTTTWNCMCVFELCKIKTVLNIQQHTVYGSK